LIVLCCKVQSSHGQREILEDFASVEFAIIFALKDERQWPLHAISSYDKHHLPASILPKASAEVLGAGTFIAMAYLVTVADA
jgi:hypothetical protein